MSNLLEDQDGTYRVVVNAENQHALWPEFADVPAGWDTAFGPAGRAECLDYVEVNWSTMNPTSLAAQLDQADRGRATKDNATTRLNDTITEQFAEQVRRRADATALRFRGEGLTYAELDERADRLARRLRGLGVGEESVVGVCFERSFEMVIALVAILKAGGAYLPVHPTEPQERFCYMLGRADAQVLLTHGPLIDRIPEVDATVVNVDDPAEPTPIDADLPAPRAAADSLAYVCYTSGSTGQPKGVSVTHQGVCRLVRDGDYADFGPDETFLQLCALTFDPATFEIWGALLNGGRLVIHEPGTLSLPDLAECIKREGVTTLWLTTGLFHRMVDGHLDDLVGLRQLLAGGDVLSPAHINRVRQAHPHVRLVNGYGPTENTCFTTCHNVQEPVGETVPIGRAITGTRVYVLDEKLRPVPDGEWGQLYTAGEGLARGYLGDARKTAQQFLPDLSRSGERMYSVGDVVRVGADGALEFRGRSDDQVKVGGYRVELGEIVAALAGQPGVKEAVVIIRQDGPGGEKALVAYVVPEGDDETLVPDLRVALRERLPRHMNPAAIVVMGRFPLTRNGKIDRAALPAPDLVPREVDSEYEAPRTPVEGLLADLVADALGVEQVGVHDDFFELGGNSLIATDLLSQIRKALAVDVPATRLFFENPTVAGLAELVETTTAAAPAENAAENEQAAT
ncbi:amino acid adenylation domain-containing protein [Streptomyces atratus]|uniref:amino acid adenylation domain-containing protein n=1 Tax=Streptomyces atratus TaxID=1893 RepID=UPI002AC371B9|nr:amino acid adenylation domain-containing protein [Streptomyces atratus]WPW26728.1 amino acid adenylation domain-containing protein [Streptomyces atratus]